MIGNGGGPKYNGPGKARTGWLQLTVGLRAAAAR
jgi:hypothetical protein